jgi:calnexin
VHRDNAIIFSDKNAVGIELWSMSSDILFDNIVITDEESHAVEWSRKTFDLKRKQIDSQAVS